MSNEKDDLKDKQKEVQEKFVEAVISKLDVATVVMKKFYEATFESGQGENISEEHKERFFEAKKELSTFINSCENLLAIHQVAEKVGAFKQ